MPTNIPKIPVESSRWKRFLPPIGSPSYHVLLAVVAIFILGPLGGISAAFMNFKIGFFIGGQVLAGILGSAVTLGYGPDGKHGANYMQTMAASVAGMCGMAVLVQAMTWLGIPEPPVWKLILYFTSIGMFGVGVGMLYTPILVDRMQLFFPSGFAVANILRALTDKNLLKRSIAKLGGGMAAGYCGNLVAGNLTALGDFLNRQWSWLGLADPKLPQITTRLMATVDAWEFSAATFGAAMIVGARITIPALLVGIIGDQLTPYLTRIGWLNADDHFRRIGFIIALGMILGAAIVDVVIILFQALQRLQAQKGVSARPAEDWKRVNMAGLIAWVVFWGIAVVMVGSDVLHQPRLLIVVAVCLVFLFVLVNGISLGISDSNPISSAFVMTVFILTAFGLKDPATGLMCASIMLIACSEGGDMQQDRSTGWRLGTNRIVQFRYQVIGIAMGAVLAIVLAKLFMSAYPVLRVDQLAHSHLEGTQKWQSAMTYKFVGALKGITNPKPYIMKALQLGIAIGLLTEIARKLLKRNRNYQQFAQSKTSGRVTDFLVDAVVLPSPYASSFGGFVELATLYWWAGGGIIATAYEGFQARSRASEPKPAEGEIPADMSTTSLVGGGLIAGDSLAALTVGIVGLLTTMLKRGG